MRLKFATTVLRTASFLIAATCGSGIGFAEDFPTRPVHMIVAFAPGGTADFTARIPAPEQTVFDAIRDIEKTHNDQVKAVRIVSQSGNKKTVDMDIAGPGGQTITTELEFEYLPDQKKIVYHTVNNPLLDTQAVYQLGDEGASTFIDYHETTHLLQSLPVPDGVIKQVIRGIFVAQLETLKRTLNLKTDDEANSGDDEP